MNRTKSLGSCGVLVVLAAFLAPETFAAGQSASRRETTTRERAATKVREIETPETSGKRSAGELISLDLKDADLKDVLRTFAELTRSNIAIDPDVKGSVTVRLTDVPWDQALDVILRINGLGCVLEGNILRVGTAARLLSEN